MIKRSLATRVFRLSLVGIVFLIGLIGIIGTNGNNEAKKPFFLAYIDREWKLQIRYSENGLEWQTATIGHPEIDRGPGLACDNDGVMYLTVFENALSKAQYNMGLGGATWDNSSTTIGDGHTGLIDSGCSIIYLGGNKYLVAFISSDQTKMYLFNTSNSIRDFESDVTPVVGVTNNNIEDRPALIKLSDKIIAAWVMTTKQVQIVTGTINSETPVWDPGYMFNVPEPGFYNPEGVIDLATDGEKYYLALMRQRVPEPDEIIKRFYMFIYSSSDGLHWERITSREIYKVSALSIAASGENNILAVCSSHVYNKVMRFNGSSWSFIDENQVYGEKLNNGGHDLTLFRRY